MKITINNHAGYAEEGQPNPLRWTILYRDAKGSFVSQSSPIKCKDFFNDYVFTYNGLGSFSIYSFNAGLFKMNKGEGMYFLLTGTFPTFEHNITKMLTPWLESQGMGTPGILKVDKGIFLHLPEDYLKNVYNMSLISLIIRLCNHKEEFNTFDDLVKATHPAKDQLKWDAVVKKGWFFKNFPEKLKEYVFYNGPENNSKKMPEYNLAGSVHNCGVLTYQSLA